MSGFELNKIISAILFALLLGMIASKVAEIAVSPKKLAKNVYVVEGVGVPTVVPVGAVGPVLGEEPIEPLLASASIENGKKIAKKCVQCHTFDKGGPNRIGPNLYGVIGQKIAQKAGFAYSKAFASLEGNWTFSNLSKLLFKPSKFVKASKMAFAGLRKAQDRADMIAYLNTLTDVPLPIPTTKVDEPEGDTSKEDANKQGAAPQDGQSPPL